MDNPPIPTERAANASESASLSISVSVSNSTQTSPINEASTSSSPSSSSLHDRPLTLDDYSFPPGFKFNPTDDELIVHYLTRKLYNNQLPPNGIVEVNVYEYSPATLVEKYAAPGADKLYCFTPREKKYPKGTRPNRRAGDGYWKATGADKEVVASNGVKVGWKKNLAFYIGRPPGGSKTSWAMHEFRIVNPPRRTPCVGMGKDMRLDDCVLCKIFQREESERSRNVVREVDQNKENEGSRDPMHGMNSSTVNANSLISQSYPSLDHHHYHYQGSTTFNSTNPANMMDSKLKSSPVFGPRGYQQLPVASRETHFKRPRRQMQQAAPLAFFPPMVRDLQQQPPSIQSIFRGLQQQPPSIRTQTQAQTHFRGLRQLSPSMQQQEVTQLPPPMERDVIYFHQPLISEASEWQPYIPMLGDMNTRDQLLFDMSSPTEYQDTFNSTVYQEAAAAAMERNMNALDSSAACQERAMAMGMGSSMNTSAQGAASEARNRFTLDSSAYQEPPEMGMGSSMNMSAGMLSLTEYKEAAASEERNMYTLDSSAYQEPAMGMGSSMNMSGLTEYEYKEAAASGPEIGTKNP